MKQIVNQNSRLSYSVGTGTGQGAWFYVLFTVHCSLFTPGALGAAGSVGPHPRPLSLRERGEEAPSAPVYPGGLSGRVKTRPYIFFTRPVSWEKRTDTMVPVKGRCQEPGEIIRLSLYDNRPLYFGRAKARPYIFQKNL